MYAVDRFTGRVRHRKDEGLEGLPARDAEPLPQPGAGALAQDGGGAGAVPGATVQVRPALGGLGRAHDDGQRTPRGGDGRTAPQAGESLTLPEGFPEDVYLPRAYAVNSVMDLQDVSVLSLRAPGKVAALFSDARNAMRTQGWKQTLAAQHSVDTAMLAFEKDSDAGRRSATLSFNRNNGDEHVIVGVQLRALQSQ